MGQPTSQPKSAAKAKRIKVPKGERGVVLLSGGNPQIAKAYGDAPVKAYIAAMPGWKRDVGKRLDALIVRTVPNVHKAVKWNSPFYGLEGQGWFAALHVFTNFVKVTFFRGTSLRPVPPGPSKIKDTRYVDIRDGELDEAQMAKWVNQAAAIMKAPSKAKPKAKGTPRASKRRTAATRSKSPPKAGAKVKSSASEGNASRLIDQRIRDLGDWRGATLARMRALILEAEPEALEEWKWMGTPVWSRHGIITTGEAYKQVVKLTFANGAKLADPSRLFNSSLEGNMRRAIDIHEGEKIDAAAFRTLVRAAVARNAAARKR